MSQDSHVAIAPPAYYDATIYCAKCGKFTPIEDPKMQNIPGGLIFQPLFTPTDLTTGKIGHYMGLSCKHCKTLLMLMLTDAVNPPIPEGTIEDVTPEEEVIKVENSEDENDFTATVEDGK
jgi:hypothetical protein